MKSIFSLIFFFLINNTWSQSASDAAVQLGATVQSGPPQITLSWVGNSTTTQYHLYRKLKTDTQWGAILATLTGTSNSFADNNVTIGTNYEYRVTRVGTGYTGHGYINSGIELPEIHSRGKLLLMVDSTFITTLNAEIARLVSDIEGDGWEVIRHDVDRNGTVTHIKDLIVNDYAVDTSTIKAVFLIGHVPVPYSGNINPDGHPDHLGAWPADCYYADVDGTWTDVSVNSTTNSPARTQNVPGDGKFDQSIVPSDLELQVGRVDFSGMSTFTLSEQQLLKNYLDKDHSYRKKITSPVKRAVMDDNFGYFSGEAFAASGYKTFGPLVGTNSVTIADYFTSMSAGSYQWSFGCGGGSYTSAGGIGTTSNFATSNLQGVFTMLFGSYFGDFDAPNNFLRAALAQGSVLTNVWSGRPHYKFHHMGLGENIGYGLLITQNNPANLYFGSPTGVTGRWVHNALMGDPTLRNDIVAPVSNVVAIKVGYHAHISWSASTETNIVGYNIYMKNDTSKIYTKINSSPVTSTSYTDNCLVYPGIYTYMVRTLKLENTPSGSYYNMSEGIADTTLNNNNFTLATTFTSAVNVNTVTFNATAPVGVTYQWDLGNGSTASGSPVITTYSANGIYNVELIASHECYSDTVTNEINVFQVSFTEINDDQLIKVYPNPTPGHIRIENPEGTKLSLRLFDVTGKIVYSLDEIFINETIDLSHFTKGMYLLRLGSDKKESSCRIILE